MGVAHAQPGMPGSIAVSPAAIGQQAVQACEAHVRSELLQHPTGGTLTGMRAGPEQDGFILVTGQVQWRRQSGGQDAFACLYERTRSRVESASVPSGQPVGPGRPTDPAPDLRAECKAAIISQVRAAHRVTPLFDGEPQLGRPRPEFGTHSAPEGMALVGTGTLPSRQDASSGTQGNIARAGTVRRFAYYCQASVHAADAMQSGFRLID